MKNFIFLLLLVGGCATHRSPVVNAPTDGAEYYQIGKMPAVVQSRLYPDPEGGLGHSQDPDIKVVDIRLTASYTVLYMTYGKGPKQGNYYSGGAISFNPKAMLASANGKKTYALLKAEGIPMTPETLDVKPGEVLPFVLYFERLDKGIESFDLFECQSDNQNSCFNVAGMNVRNPADSARPN